VSHYGFFQLYPTSTNEQFNMIFFLAATILVQIRECYTLYTQWEGWRVYGVEIAWTSNQRDGFQSEEE
jgi:hypothetical protein